jgi:hypothetical protein
LHLFINKRCKIYHAQQKMQNKKNPLQNPCTKNLSASCSPHTVGNIYSIFIRMKRNFLEIVCVGGGGGVGRGGLGAGVFVNVLSIFSEGNFLALLYSVTNKLRLRKKKMASDQLTVIDKSSFCEFVFLD